MLAVIQNLRFINTINICKKTDIQSKFHKFPSKIHSKHVLGLIHVQFKLKVQVEDELHRLCTIYCARICVTKEIE